ncbi:hypothetical protein ABZ914_47210, partial [Spirillospora sp. NPDC046719]
MLLGDLAHRGAVLWPARTAFAWDGGARTYRELHARVERCSGQHAPGAEAAGERSAVLTVNDP